MSEIIIEEMTNAANSAAKNETSDVQNDCTLNKHADAEEKVFTQNRLEEIIRERLGRERKNNEDLSAVKNLLKEVSDKGIIKGTSYSEMAKSLVEKLSGYADRHEEKCENDVCVRGEETDTPVAADAGGNNHIENRAENTVKSDDEKEMFIKTLSEIKAKYPTADTLLSGDNFRKFAKGRSGSISEIFDDYYDFVTSFESAEQNGENESHASLASTAFSAGSGVSDEGTSLTKQQMEIAKSAGMSYREYSRLLESIPQRAARRN